MLRKIRRIVTGHNAQGKSVIASDAPSPHVLSLMTDPPFGLTDLWVTHGSPADNSGSAGGAMDHEGTRHAGMHKTATVDYAIVLSGEIYAVMDEGETLMGGGDCLVQRGTNHAWSNRSNAPCLVAFILVSANPL